MRISNNFHLSELIRSSTAQRYKINNEPSEVHKQHLIDATINLWQVARDALGVPMIVSSGYRSPTLNKKVGGSKTSAHSHGYAIDFTAPSFGNTRKVAEFLANYFKAKGIKFDQIILEFPDSPNSWIHLGYKNKDGLQRMQLLTAKYDKNGRTKYFTGFV